jgi:hypothetical protein
MALRASQARMCFMELIRDLYVSHEVSSNITFSC